MREQGKVWSPVAASFVTGVSRRRLLGRGARAAVGAVGLALVGCGEDAGVAVAPEVETEGASVVAESVVAEEAVEAVEAGAPRSGSSAAAEGPPVEVAPVVEERRRLYEARRCVGCAIEDPSFEALPGAEVRFGIHDGAGYRIEVPERWNGTLVLWFHGFTGLNEAGTAAREDLVFGDLPPRELLLAAGVAWAASTSGASGYVPAVSVDDLLSVKDIFVAAFGVPDQVYGVGLSLGGAAAQLVAQEFPDEIDGAVALCGALSNVEVVDAIASWHALALWFIGEAPSRVDADGLVEWSRALGSVDEVDRLHLTAAGEQFASVVEAMTGGPRWGFRDGLRRQWERGFEVGALLWPDFVGSAALEEPGGEVVVNPLVAGAIDTRGVVYQAGADSGVDVAALNREVVRLASAPADRMNPAIGVASGRLKVPLLTVKGTGDLFTPISLDRSYLARVRAAGDEGNLVMRAVRRSGHCRFTTPEITRALLDLGSWARDGDRPAGEDLSGDLGEVGVAFTSSFDADDPLGR